MNLPSLLLLSIICSALSSLSASKSSEDLLSLHDEQREINRNASLENRSNGISAPRPLKQHENNNHRGLRAVHGTLNIVGWGFLLPTGVMIARYLRETTDDWYNLHIMSQLSGFLFGTVGWGIGIYIKNENHLSTHGIIGTIIFALATLEPNEEHKYHKYWVIYHNFVGWALIVMIIANIFQGISNQNAPKKWDLFYGIVLGVLGIVALVLEILRWIYA